MRHYSSNLWINIYGKNGKFTKQKNGIWSLFVSIWFEIDGIVCDQIWQLPSADSTRIQKYKMAKHKGNSIVADHSITDPEIEGLNPAIA